MTIRGFDNAAIEDTKRLLINLLPLKNAITRTSDMLDVDLAETSIYPAPVYVEKSSLEYRVRNTALGRLSIPHPRIARPESVDDAHEPVVAPTSPNAVLDGLVDRTAANIIQTVHAFPQTEELGIWVPEPSNRLVAKFGQALVPLEHVGAEEPDSDVSERFSQNAFVSTLPGLSSVLALTEPSVNARLHSPNLNYYFRPDPEQTGFEANQLFPSLKIKMTTDHQGEKAYFRKASIRFWQHAHTVSLPNKAADVQFYKYGVLTLRKDHADTRIQKWIGAAIKSIRSGGRIDAPPLSVDIPKWTIPGFSSDEKGMATVKYHFSGVEFRQILSGTMLGEKITYSTNQSGKLNAKGGELLAYYNGHGDEEMRDETAIKAFVKSCHGIVDLITNASARTSPLSKQIRPRHAESARKARRFDMVNGASNTVDTVSGQASTGTQERVANDLGVQEDTVMERPNSVEDEVPAEEPAEAEAQHGDENAMPSQPSIVPEKEEGNPADSSSKNA